MQTLLKALVFGFLATFSLSQVARVSQVTNAIADNLNFPHVQLVDYNSTNQRFLFRGNLPIINNTFAWFTLRDYLQKRATEADLILPYPYYLIDISLIRVDREIERRAYDEEIKFFQENPSYGELIHWPLRGDILSPWDETSNLQELSRNLSEWQSDKLLERVKLIHDLLHKPNDDIEFSNPVVIYVHCRQGRDRTGELAGSYVLQYKNWRFDEILTYNRNLDMRVPYNFYALGWYCRHLQYWGGKDLNCAASEDLLQYLSRRQAMTRQGLI